MLLFNLNVTGGRTALTFSCPFSLLTTSGPSTRPESCMNPASARERLDMWNHIWSCDSVLLS